MRHPDESRLWRLSRPHLCSPRQPAPPWGGSPDARAVVALRWNPPGQCEPTISHVALCGTHVGVPFESGEYLCRGAAIVDPIERGAPVRRPEVEPSDEVQLVSTSDLLLGAFRRRRTRDCNDLTRLYRRRTVLLDLELSPTCCTGAGIPEPVVGASPPAGDAGDAGSGGIGPDPPLPRSNEPQQTSRFLSPRIRRIVTRCWGSPAPNPAPVSGGFQSPRWSHPTRALFLAHLGR